MKRYKHKVTFVILTIWSFVLFYAGSNYMSRRVYLGIETTPLEYAIFLIVSLGMFVVEVIVFLTLRHKYGYKWKDIYLVVDVGYFDEDERMIKIETEVRKHNTGLLIGLIATALFVSILISKYRYRVISIEHLSIVVALLATFYYLMNYLDIVKAYETDEIPDNEGKKLVIAIILFFVFISGYKVPFHKSQEVVLIGVEVTDNSTSYSKPIKAYLSNYNSKVVIAKYNDVIKEYKDHEFKVFYGTKGEYNSTRDISLKEENEAFYGKLDPIKLIHIDDEKMEYIFEAK